MLKRFAVLFVCVFLANCAHHVEPTLTSPARSSTQNRAMHSYNKVQAKGVINIHLHTGFRKSGIVLVGDARDLQQVVTTVKDSTLYLTVPNGYPKYGMMRADVNTRFLNRFSFEGSGDVTGNSLRTSYLDVSLENGGTTRLGGSIGLQRLEVDGGGVVHISGVNSKNLHVELNDSPKVHLSGVIGIRHLEVNGKGLFSAYWLKADTLTVRASDNAKIYLAGVAKVLDVALWDHAEFKGRYLRATRSFAKTRNHATAEISAINHQSTLATDASDIYYYNHSTTRADFMAFDGSVLDMREFNPEVPQYMTRYNKQYP